MSLSTVMTPEDLMPALDRLETTIQAMTTVLAKETAAVKAIDIGAFTALQVTKNTLLSHYQSDMKTLVDHQATLRTLPEPVKVRIRNMERDLSSARVANLSALERAGKSFLRLRDRIVCIARDTALRAGAPYTANGALHMRTRHVITTGTISDHA